MLRVLELSWLIIVILGASLGVYKMVTENLTSAIWFFLFTIVAMLFWMIRRKQRIRMEKKGK